MKYIQSTKCYFLWIQKFTSWRKRLVLNLSLILKQIKKLLTTNKQSIPCLYCLPFFCFNFCTIFFVWYFFNFSALSIQKTKTLKNTVTISCCQNIWIKPKITSFFSILLLLWSSNHLAPTCSLWTSRQACPWLFYLSFQAHQFSFSSPHYCFQVARTFHQYHCRPSSCLLAKS